MEKMYNHIECIKNKLLGRRESLQNGLPTVYVKYNVPKAIRSLNVDEKGSKSNTAPSRLNRISFVTKALRSAMEKKNLDRRSKFTLRYRNDKSKNTFYLPGFSRLYQ